MRAFSLCSVGVVTALVIAIGCGGSRRSGFQENEQTSDPNNPNGLGGDDPSGGFGGEVGGDVQIDPVNTTLIIDTATNPITPGTIKYKVISKGKDVSGSAKLELEKPDLGTFSSSNFISTTALPNGIKGVSTIVKAATGDGVGLARLTLVQLRKTGPQRDFFFILPYKGDPSPKNDVLEFGTSIKNVDVAFAMDTTASMGGSISALKTALSSSLLADLQASIPGVGLAIVDYRDYPISPYGSTGSVFATGDFPAKVHQKITTNLSAAQSAVAQYVAGGGNDGPESQIPAMQHILTGEALTWSGGSVPKANNAPGMWGGVDFRPGAVPVVVNITDIDWHGEGHVPYNFATPTMASLKTAFTNANAFFVNATSGDEAQANELSDATKSNVPAAAFGGTCGAGQCCTDSSPTTGRPANGPGGTCRLNFKHNNGAGLGTSITKAIQAISVGASYDVKAVASNDPKNKAGIDATKFIQALRAIDEGNAAAGCPAVPAKDTNNDGIKDTFLNVTVGTKVCFEVIPAKNTTVPPETEPQFYNALVDVVGVQGNVQLDHRDVMFLIPPTDPGVN
jgi:hypothetical protein